MTKEKLASLNKYAQSLKDKISSAVPSKHATHPASYKLFLTRELETVNATLEKARLEGAQDKK